ncbi:MAG TPA: MBL fold metallo-hydrolase [Noviherbaspirillum sp.]
MKITQLRNATVMLEIGKSRILIDPMLAPQGALPPLKFIGGRQRNPIVALPEAAGAMLEGVTHCLITHCQKGHFDHLDRTGKRWLRERKIPVICTPHDAAYLKERGLNVAPLPDNHRDPAPFLDGCISTVPCVHGTGLVGRFMEHGVGYLIEMPGEPSLYLSGDTILTPELRDFLTRRQPQVSLVPAGGARFDIGSEIIMGVNDVIAVARLVTGAVIANHMEALGHCPVTRAELADAARRAGVADRLHIPADGETLEF